MTTATAAATPTATAALTATATAADARTTRLLEAPILPLLLRMAWPNVLVMLAQSAAGLIETYWVSRLGTDALAGMALVFPPFLLMTMLAGGAMGGGIASAVARALGAGRQADADAVILHACVINGVLGLVISAAVLAFGPDIYRLAGGTGGDLQAALAYSNVVFAGNIFIWIMNALASVVRGTGNMIFPAVVIMIGVVVLVPLSPLLIFGAGSFGGFGVAGGGYAIVAFNVAATIAMALHIAAGRNPVRFRWVRLRRSLFANILHVGAISAVNSLMTNFTIAIATALVAAVAGTDAIAGYGTGARLEFLLIPLVFGIGAPLVALVGTNIGAGRRDRALAIALTGGALAFAVTEAIGLLAAIFPDLWLRLFSADPGMLAVGRQYLRVVGPAYGFFGLGLCLYFSSQGAGRLFWPLVTASIRLAIALGLGALVLHWTGSLAAFFACLAAALVFYGIALTAAVRAGLWFR